MIQNLEPRCREARHHTSTSKVDDQLFQKKRADGVAPNPQSFHGPNDVKSEGGQHPPNCVKASKPSHYDEKFEKKCQIRKDEENQHLPNFPKDNKKFDEGYRRRKFDENYGKASGVTDNIARVCPD